MQDIVFVLDQMLAANADSASSFFGGIDPARLGMSGHSLGELTTLEHDLLSRQGLQ